MSAREQYLKRLRDSLSSMPKREVDEIIRDQDEYIRDAMAAGRSEAEVIQALGSPETFASRVRAEVKISFAHRAESWREKTSSIMGAVIAVLALAPLNMIFVFGPFVLCASLIFTGWAIAGATALVGGAFVVEFFSTLVSVSVSTSTHLSALLFSLGVIALGIWSALLMFKLTQWFMAGTIAYLKWNLNFIRARS